MHPSSSSSKAPVLAGTMLAVLIAALDNTVVATAMPACIADLRDPLRYSWPFTAQLIAETATVPLAGKLSDRLGRKTVILAGIAIYLIASVACSLAPSMLFLAASRALAGIGGGILISSSFAIVAELVQPDERGKYIGLLASMFGVASLAGPILGGFVTQVLSWRWAFLVGLPLGLASLLLVGLALPARRPGQGAEAGRFDLAGLLLFLGAILPFLLAISEGGNSIPWTSPLMAALGALALTSAFLFLRREGRAASPLLPPALFRDPSFRAASASALLAYFAFFGCILFVPRFAHDSLGLSLGGSGLLLLPLTVGMMFAGNLGGMLAGRTRAFSRLGSLGFLLAMAASLVLSAATAWPSLLGLVLGCLLLGLGLGLTLPVYNMAAQFSFPLAMVGLVTAMLEFFQDLGGALGSAVLGGVAAAGQAAVGHGESLGFLVAAASLLGAGLLMSRLDDTAIARGMEAQGGRPRDQAQ